MWCIKCHVICAIRCLILLQFYPINISKTTTIKTTKEGGFLMTFPFLCFVKKRKIKRHQMFKEFANYVTNPRSKWKFPKEHRSPVAALYLTVVLRMSKSNQNVRERRHELCFASAIRILAMRLERSYQHLECDINACKTPSKRKTGKYTQPKPQVPSQMLLVFLPCTCCAANIMLSAKRRWVKRLTQDVLARYPNTACSIARVTCAPATLLTASLVQKNAGRTRRKRKTSRYTPSKPRAS